jgi:alkaline phosphatase
MQHIDSSFRKRQPVLSFGVFADLHYAEKVYGNRYCQQSLDKLRVCIDSFNDRCLPMAFNLGDSIDKVEDREAELGYLKDVCDVFSSFRGERYLVLGNHDLETLTKEEFLKNSAARIKEPYYSFDRDCIHFVVLDGNCRRDGTDFNAGNFDWKEAWISGKQLLWLEDDLTKNKDRKTIIFCHENLDDRQKNGHLDSHIVRNAREVQAILVRAGNVLAVIQGHYHPGMHTVFEGIPYIMAAAVTEGPGPENNACAIVSVFEDNTLVVEGLGRQESLSFL